MPNPLPARKPNPPAGRATLEASRQSSGSQSIRHFVIHSTNTLFNQTTIHPLGIFAVLILGLAMIMLPRRQAVVPMLLMACFIATAQRVVIFTLDFDVMRLMVICGWVRLMLRGELKVLRLRSLDLVVIVWAISGTVAMTLLYMSSKALIYRLGFMYDAVGMYFLFRCLVRNWQDVETIAVSVVWISIPVAAAFMLERSTGRNIFSIFGGVPAITMLRNGDLRCQGAYSHPILAGSFWASLLPLIIATAFRSDWRKFLAPVGIFCAFLIIFATASSTPLMATMISVIAMMMFLMKRMIRVIRWIAIPALLLLQVTMTNPLWHLLARIDLTGGSTGWYRYKLIDDFIKHFSDWCLFGTKSTAAWREWGSNDITNQYVLEGVTGGFLTLLLFFLIIILAFRGVSRFENPLGKVQGRRIMAWAVGSALFVHCVIFIGVSYFGQIQMLWFLTLAMIGSLSPASRTVHRLSVMRRAGSTAALGEKPTHLLDVSSRPGVALKGRFAQCRMAPFEKQETGVIA